jgi:hypothetical protein
MHILQHLANFIISQLQILDLLIQITYLITHQGNVLLKRIQDTGVYGNHSKILILILLHGSIFFGFFFLQEEKMQFAVVVGLKQTDKFLVVLFVLWWGVH